MINPKSQIKVSGIFNEESYSFFKNQGIFHFGFDFRPKSLNFIQEHVLVSLIENLQMGSVTLIFENEKDFMIKRIIDEVRKKFSGEIILEFHGDDNFSLFDSLGYPYYYIPKNEIAHPKGRNQIGIILNQDLLNELLENGKLHEIDVSTISKINLKFTSKIDFPNSFVDFIDWEFLDLEIDQSLCLNYRVLDEENVNLTLKQMENFIKGKKK